MSSAVSVQVSFSDSKAPATTVHKGDIRNHFRPSESDNSGNKRKPISPDTKKPIEVISLLSSDESSSDDGENEGDVDDQLAESLQSLKLQSVSTPILEESPLKETGPSPDSTHKQQDSYENGSTTPLLFEDEVENEYDLGDQQRSFPEQDASSIAEELEGSVEVQDPRENRSTTPILVDDSDDNSESSLPSPFIDDDIEITPPDRIATPILFETAEEAEYELGEQECPDESSFSDHEATSIVKATPDKQDSPDHIISTTPILDDEDREEEYEPQSEQECSHSSTPEHDSSSTSSLNDTPEKQDLSEIMSTTPLLHDDSTTASPSPPSREHDASSTQSSLNNSSSTPLLLEREPEIQEYSDKDDDDDPAHKATPLHFKTEKEAATEYEPCEQEFSESMALLDSSECENSCWIPELVEIQSLLQNCHDYPLSEPDKKVTAPPTQHGPFKHLTIEDAAVANNTISPLKELSPVNRRRSSVDRFLNNCAQPDLFFSPPVPRNPSEFESELKSSWDSRTSLLSNIDCPTFMSVQEPQNRDGGHLVVSSPRSQQQIFLNTPSEAISRVIVHTTSKPAIPFLCVSSDSDTSTVSKHSISRDSILSVDHMADRFVTDDVTSPVIQVIPDPSSSGGKWQAAVDSRKIDDSLEDIQMCILQKESNSFRTDDVSEQSPDRNDEIAASKQVDVLIDSMESITLSDSQCVNIFPTIELALPSNSSNMELKSDCPASLEESNSFSNRISTTTWTSGAEVLAPLYENDETIEAFGTDIYTDHLDLDTYLTIDSYSEETIRQSVGTVHKSESVADTHTPARSPVEQDIPDALLSYTHLQDVVVEPFPLLDDATSAATIVASRNSSLLSSLRSDGVVLEDILVPLKPVEGLTAEDIRLYNDCIVEANAHEDMLQAAVSFMQAISICDSDFKLHCKLAWICDTLKKQK